jgi:ketosteroid isomerase-like protein
MTRHVAGRFGGALLCLLLGMAGTASAQATGASAGIEEAVKQVELARGQALLNADTVALSRMTAAEFMEISRFGTIRARADNIREISSGALKLETVRFDSLAVRAYGDVAILTGITDNTGRFQGQQFAGRIRYTRVFVNRDGRWQAVLMQHTMMATP